MALNVLKNARRRKRSASGGSPDTNRNSPSKDLELTLVINVKDVHTQITKTIGEGSYSIVYEGSWESHNGLVST